MPRTITYTDTVVIPEPVLDTVRDAAHSWHNPNAGNHYERLRENPVVEDGTQQMNDNNEALYSVQVKLSMTGVSDGSIDTTLDSIVTAVNSATPDAYPTVTTDDIAVSSA